MTSRRAHQLVAWCLAAAMVAFARPLAAAPVSGDTTPPVPGPTATATAGESATMARVLLDAQAAYDRGTELLPRDPTESRRMFRAAADGFQLVLDSGGNDGRLWYNLGNARLQAGELGAAIAAYLEAERLIPNDARLRANLRHARTLRRDQIAATTEQAVLDALATPRRFLAPRVRLHLALGVYVLFWVLLGVRLRWPVAAPISLLVACAALTALLAGSVVVDEWTTQPATRGVLVADAVTVRKGNGEGFEPAVEQTLGQGVEFAIRERRPGWLGIRLPDGSEGWVRENQAVVVGARSAS